MAEGFRPAPFDVVEASRHLWLDRWGAEAASGNAVFTAILRANQVLMQEVERVMKVHGLTFTRYQVLTWLESEPESARALSWISTVLRVPPATVTNIIDRLEADGLVRRVPHPTDARTTLAEITDRMLSANAYIGAGPVVDALAAPFGCEHRATTGTASGGMLEAAAGRS